MSCLEAHFPVNPTNSKCWYVTMLIETLLTSQNKSGHDTSLKWLKVTVSTQKHSHYSVHEPNLNQSQSYFSCKSCNFKFFSYTMLNKFAPNKQGSNVSTALIIDLHVQASLMHTSHLDSWLHITTVNTFSECSNCWQTPIVEETSRLFWGGIEHDAESLLLCTL